MYKRDPKTGRFLPIYNISKEELYDLYVVKGLSLSSIAKIYGVDDETIRYRLKVYGIDRRTGSSSHLGYRRLKGHELPVSNPSTFVWKLGWVISFTQGDGHVYKTRYSISYGSTDKEQIETVSRIIYDLFEFKGSYVKSGFTHVVSYNNIIFYKLMTSLASYGTTEWKVPDWLLKARDEQIKLGYISGFFDSEGVFIEANGFIGAVSTNKRGLEDIGVLFEQVGLLTPVVKKIRNGDDRLKPLYRLEVVGRDAKLEFCKVIKLLIPRKRRKLERIYEKLTKVEVKV